MSQKHTPGPWKVIAGDDYMVYSDATPEAYPHRCKSDDLGRFVAQVGNRGHAFGRYDADLIAAAPDMLEALVAMLENYGPPLASVEYPSGHPITVARAAITKATGVS